jgi:hypothetical protein
VVPGRNSLVELVRHDKILETRQSYQILNWRVEWCYILQIFFSKTFSG